MTQKPKEINESPHQDFTLKRPKGRSYRYLHCCDKQSLEVALCEDGSWVVQCGNCEAGSPFDALRSTFK